MYKSIQVINSCRLDKINEHGAVGFNQYNDGGVEALLKNGATFRAPFGGFIEGSNLFGLKRVKLLSIRYFCEDAEALKPNYQIPKDHYVVGVYLESSLYVLLVDGQPKHFLETTADSDGKNNVVRLV
jgi:hypothetical protein